MSDKKLYAVTYSLGRHDGQPFENDKAARRAFKSSLKKSGFKNSVTWNNVSITLDVTTVAGLFVGRAEVHAALLVAQEAAQAEYPECVLTEVLATRVEDAFVYDKNHRIGVWSPSSSSTKPSPSKGDGSKTHSNRPASTSSDNHGNEAVKALRKLRSVGLKDDPLHLLEQEMQQSEPKPKRPTRR